MNRKVEDRLIDLAFGDLTPEEAASLEARAAHDPVSASTLQAYRDMRESLRSMADLPEHQLSNERLKNAILARGLSQKETTPAPVSSRGWIWMPIAACAMAFTLVMWRNTAPGSDVGPQIVLGSKALDAVAFNAKPLEQPTAEATEPIPSTTKAVEPELVPAPAHETNRHVAKAPSNPVRATRTKAVHHRTTMVAQSKRQEKVETQDPAPIILRASDVSEASSALPIVSTDQPIVLIAQEKDADTGAQVATEVESESNVLVGG
jgi:hypothetical protein